MIGKGWPREELERRLRERVGERYHHRHPFNVRMHEGRLRPDEIRRWILNRYHYQRSIPVKDAVILSRLPGRDERRAWVHRIVDHDGREGDPGGLEAWLRLGEAAGLAREDLLDEGNVLAGVRFAVQAYVTFCREQSWQEAVASSLTEMLAPDLIARRITAFEQHYPWVESWGLDYFRSRLTQGPRDARAALELVLDSAATAEQQRRAIAAVTFKCDVLWSLLDAIDHGGTDGDTHA